MAQRAWRVWLNQRHLTTVWFDSDMGPQEVKRSLVEHDGYNPNIVVRLER